MTLETKQKRDALRKRMRTSRLMLSEKALRDAESHIFEKVIALSLLKERRTIGSYVGLNGEINTMLLNNYLKAKKHTVALPVIHPTEKGQMQFYTYDDDGSLVKNRFGIPEPQPFRDKLITPNLFEVLLIPLLAFDIKGNRLGMGGGYYDRLLKKVSADCVLIGLAHDFQCVDELPSEDWDMPLDEIITPTRHLMFIKKY